MATTRPKLTELRVLGAKLETTTGTQIAIAAGDGAFNVRNMKVTPTIVFNERPGQGSFSSLPGVTGQQSAKLTFEIEMAGSGTGTAPAWATTFLPAMGYYQSAGTNNIFAPISGPLPTNNSTLTMFAYEDGIAQVLVGCVGTGKIMLEAGKPALLSCEFEGAYIGPTTVANITPTYPTVLPPVFQNSTVTVGSFGPQISKAEIDLGNKIYMRPDASTNSATGFVSGVIVDRKVKGSMDPECTALATRNWYSNLVASTTEALTINIGVAANHNAIQIAGPVVQCSKRERGDRSGIMTDDVDLQFNRSAAAGDDELTITIP